MDHRTLGRTGLRVSALGFGCGNVGGLVVRGSPAERERAIARAIELGVNYFDTAPLYGDGFSETHLGHALGVLGADVLVGTKFRLAPADAADVPAAITRSLDASLGRLAMDHVDLLQCHNPIVADRDAPTTRATDAISVRVLLDDVIPTLAKLRDRGKVRFWGITALGETPALHQAVGSGALDTAQVCLNLLNPSAAVGVPSGFPAQDFGALLEATRASAVGAIVIRVLAGGALSGVVERHALAAPAVAPIASGPDYVSDVERSRRFAALVVEGHATSVTEASIRFALASDAVSTVLVGPSTIDHLEAAVAAVDKGPLKPAALDRLREIWRGMVA